METWAVGKSSLWAGQRGLQSIFEYFEIFCDEQDGVWPFWFESGAPELEHGLGSGIKAVGLAFHPISPADISLDHFR